ncbi:MAG: glycosyltransferase family 2 protein [Candidatus Sumerlaeaceae bacterium]
MELRYPEPACSILLATYNRAPLLSRAIESVLQQTCKHWELIVVDDGSQDSTPHILAHFAQRDKRIRWLSQENRGLVGARNRAARLATGRWITFLDSDDEYLPSHLELRLNFVRDHPHVDMVHGGFVVVGGSAYVPDIHDPTRLVHLSACVVGGTFFIRKDAFVSLGGFRSPNFGCDYELFQRAQRILRIEKVEFPTYVYHRDSQDSMCKLEGDFSSAVSNGRIPREET